MMNLVLVERAVVGGNLDGGTGSRNMIGWLVTRGNYQGKKKKCLRKIEMNKKLNMLDKIKLDAGLVLASINIPI
jgi:hypothetical protein